MVTRRLAASAVPAIIALALLGCSADPDASSPEASQACLDAATTALGAEADLYENHPLWSAEMPVVDASDEERAAYDALVADEEAQWNAIYSPIYSACTSPSDWWATAKVHPGIAGVTGAEFLDPESLRVWCEGSETAPACTGIDEWLATNPK